MSHQFLAADIIVEGLEGKRESWEIEHRQVMQNYDTADCLDKVAELLLFAVQTLDHSVPSADNIQAMTLSWSFNLCERYERWYNVATSILADIDLSEEKDFPVSRSNELRTALHRVGQMLPEMTRHKQRIDDLRAGKCVPLKDALDGMGSSATPGYRRTPK